MERPFSPESSPENRKLENEQERPPPKRLGFLHELEIKIGVAMALLCVIVMFFVEFSDVSNRIIAGYANHKPEEVIIVLLYILVGLLAVLGIAVVQLSHRSEQHSERNRDVARKGLEQVGMVQRDTSSSLKKLDESMRDLSQDVRDIDERSKSSDLRLRGDIRDIGAKLGEVYSVAYNSARALGKLGSIIEQEEAVIEALETNNLELKRVVAGAQVDLRERVSEIQQGEQHLEGAVQAKIKDFEDKLARLDHDVKEGFERTDRKIELEHRRLRRIIAHDRTPPRAPDPEPAATEVDAAPKEHRGVLQLVTRDDIN